MPIRFLFLALLILLPLISGCGEKNPHDTIPVTGTVLVDGSPMHEVQVLFSPATDGQGVGAFGVTDAEGNFTLTTPQSPHGSGAVAGTYNVTFSKLEVNPNANDSVRASDLDDKGEMPEKVMRKSLINQKYNKAATSEIKPVSVSKDGNNHFTFELSK